MNKEKKSKNFLEFIPVRNFKWYVSNETNKVVVERPKFDNAILKKYLLPYFKKQNFDVKLDEFGSFVWQQMDSRKNVYEIANDLEKEFGEKVQPVYERLSKFIKHLYQQRFVKYKTTI
jgi:hypothetical protein